MAHDTYLERISIRKRGVIQFIDVQDVMYIEASGNYIEIFTESKKYLLRSTLKGVLSKLNAQKFFRIHRSVVINIDYLKEIQTWFHGDYMVIMVNNKKLPMSRNYKTLLENI